MGKGQYDGNEYEIHLVRRDNRSIPKRDQPSPVVEHIDLKDQDEVNEVVGRHFVRMAACAADVTVKPKDRIRDLDFIHDYQCEIWRTWGNPREPEMVSMSTEGWRD